MFRQLRAIIADALAMPGRFIDACNLLSEKTHAQTEALEALHTTLKAIEKSAKYIATSEEHRMRREGRSLA